MGFKEIKMDMNIVGRLNYLNRTVAQIQGAMNSHISGANTSVARTSINNDASPSKTRNRTGVNEVEAMHSDGASSPTQNTGAEPTSSEASSSSDSLNQPINTNEISLEDEISSLLGATTAVQTLITEESTATNNEQGSMGTYLYNCLFQESLANEWVSNQLNTTNQSAQNVLIKLCNNELTIPAGSSLTKIFNQLIKEGANIHLKNNNGQSPLDIAKSNSGDNVTNKLLKSYLDVWANEDPEEVEHRQWVKNKIQIIDGKLHIQGNLYLRGYHNITTLPQGLTVRGNLDVTKSSGFMKCIGNSLIGTCTTLTALPENLHVGGELRLDGCTSLTSLPENLHVGGNLYLRGCTSLTSLPDGVFELQRTQTVYAENTGIPARLLAEYNTRQNAPRYNGPRINFSINDYRPTSNVSARQLPNLIKTITQTNTNHQLWQFATNQIEQGSLFNSFALFLTRLLNELPEGNKRQTDLVKLRQKLTPLFRKMEAEYDLKNQDISQCDFINNHILSAAETATGTCIDKVKVGYLFMQLFVKDNFQQDLTTMNTIIKTVEDIASARIVFNAENNQFIHVAKTILDGNFDDTLKQQAKYLLKQTDDSSIELTDDEMTLSEDSSAFSMNKNSLTQLLYSAIVAQNPQIRSMRIGDQVEDILNLAYKLLSSNFHKIDMRFDCCCTLKNSNYFFGPQYETAVINSIKDDLSTITN